jgi:hypothetical protein
MRLRNARFEFVTFFAALFWLGCAVASIADYVKGGPASFLITALIAGIFLVLAVLSFRVSLYLGDLRRRR